MSAVLVIIHVIVCVALILIVLLQTGKAADMGAAFGGGSSQTLFGSTGASTFLSKATTVAAIVFMLTSLTLAYISSDKTRQSVMENAKAPITQTAPDAETGMPVAADQASKPNETPVQPADQK